MVVDSRYLMEGGRLSFRVEASSPRPQGSTPWLGCDDPGSGTGALLVDRHGSPDLRRSPPEYAQAHSELLTCADLFVIHSRLRVSSNGVREVREFKLCQPGFWLHLVASGAANLFTCGRDFLLRAPIAPRVRFVSP